MLPLAMAKRLFTERHGQGKPRTAELLDGASKTGLVAMVAALVDQDWFGKSYPSRCPDGTANAGCDRHSLQASMAGYGLVWPRPSDVEELADGQVFDLLEFSYEMLALPIEKDFHGYYRHHHFDYDQPRGRVRFAEEVNRIFERNGIAFELKDGEVVRLMPSPIAEPLATAIFDTGDPTLDEMLEGARLKFLNKDLKVRQESLGGLWAAWERLKTLELGANKKASIKVLLDKGTAEPTFRQVLEDEAARLTKIGNDFMIRHSEVGKVPVDTSIQVDYLFQRLFSLVQLLLKASGRGG